MFIKFSVLSVFTLFVLSSKGQFYYKDLVSTLQINSNFHLLKQNKIKLVKLKSYQGNMPVEEGFVCEQRVNLSRNEVVTYTKTSNSPESYFTASYNLQGLLSKTIDSSEESVSTARYSYNNSGKLEWITSETRATDNSPGSIETHHWEYKNDKPFRMIRKKSAFDSTIIYFTIDEKGNVSVEEPKGGKTPARKTFYYYDDKNRLTDIVRFNEKLKQLLPDYIFEYEDEGQIATMTVVPEGSNDYQKWYYKYDDGGLRLVEFCYNKRQELLGKVEYDYEPSR